MFQPVTTLLFLFLIVFFITQASTFILLRATRVLGVIDKPNARSSHQIPVPRGGGLSFVLSFFIFLLILMVMHVISFELFAAFMIPGFFLAFVGALDDWYGLSAKVRLFFHFFAALIGLILLQGLASIGFGYFIWRASLTLNVFALVYLIWFVNLYNFMDGIDGLATIEAITISFGLGSILYWHGFSPLLPFGLGVACLGFLFWNFPFARFFMGDVGSGFLGMILGLFSIYVSHFKSEFFLSFLILSGVFIIDATYTLIVRWMRKAPIMEAHALHAYQHAVRRYGQHYFVTGAIFLINILWLYPLAFWASLGVGVNSLFLVLIAWTPLFLLAHYYGAGREKERLLKGALSIS